MAQITVNELKINPIGLLTLLGKNYAGSSNSILLAAVCAMFAAGFGCVMLVAGNKKRKA